MIEYSLVSFEIPSVIKMTIIDDLSYLSIEKNKIDFITQENGIAYKGIRNVSGKISFDNTAPSSSMSFSLYEEERYYIILESSQQISENAFNNPFSNSLAKILNHNLFLQESMYKYSILCEIKTKNFVGIIDFSTEKLENLFINIVPAKIDFNSDYELIISDISENLFELASRLGSINQIPVSRKNYLSKSKFMESLHIQNLIKSLLESLDVVIAHPYTHLEETLTFVPFGTQYETDITHLITSPSSYNWIQDGPFSQKFHGYSPLEINNINKQTSFDNYPNRFVKYVIKYILEILYEIKDDLTRKSNPSSFDLIRLDQVTDWISNIEMRLYNSFLNSVSDISVFNHTSQVLEKRIGYQEINQFYERIQTGIELDLQSPIKPSETYYSKPINDLYEIWCFLTIESILSSFLSASEKKQMLALNDSFTVLSLQQGKKSAVKYIIHNKEITLYYNYVFTNPGSYSLTFKPDITISIKCDTGSIFHHFDAKYKIAKETGSYKEEDIWKMHAYKDGILNSKGASILYPGNQTASYKHNDGYINAIPLVPSNPETLMDLKRFIDSLLN